MRRFRIVRTLEQRHAILTTTIATPLVPDAQGIGSDADVTVSQPAWSS